MNYFELHIGDYAEATQHLTFVEDAAYIRCIRKYYSTEKPLPADVKAVQRLVGARTKEERVAVEAVLGEFFELREDGWHQERCDAEIERFRAGEPEREARKANEENRLRRHRDERARLFKIITDAGLHAAWNIGTAELRAMAERVSGGPPETASPPSPATAPATPATATHTPDTNTHTPDQKPELPTSSGAAAPKAVDPPEVRDPVWHTGLSFLRRKGLPEDQARRFLGKLKRELGDIEAAALLKRAEDEDVTDPVPWLSAAASAVKARAGPGRKPSAADSFTGKTYEGTAVDDLPESLRDAVRAELAAG